MPNLTFERDLKWLQADISTASHAAYYQGRGRKLTCATLMQPRWNNGWGKRSDWELQWPAALKLSWFMQLHALKVSQRQSRCSLPASLAGGEVKTADWSCSCVTSGHCETGAAMRVFLQSAPEAHT